jgi:hypothetical protein
LNKYSLIYFILKIVRGIKMDIRDRIQVALLVTGLTAFGLGEYSGYKDGSRPIKDLEDKVEVLQGTINSIKHENYTLQLDLIKRDNPYKWELYGDGLGSWGYRRPDDGSAILGATEIGYIYLQGN